MTARNVLVICSDQHNPNILGAHGDPVISTPNLDALAARGTDFVNAVTPSPICVPARASLATGRYPHELQTWDNGAPYTGDEAPSWGHRLADAGCAVSTIGKLHYRAATDPTGFTDQRLPMHVRDGVGDAYPSLRGMARPRFDSRRPWLTPVVGESEYTRYDQAIEDAAVDHLENVSDDVPWASFVSFTNPHFPLAAPQEYLERYPLDAVPMPPLWRREDWPEDRGLAEIRYLEMLDEPLEEEQARRAIATYYAMVELLDARIGRILTTLEARGLTETTTVLYISDHGDMIGSHGLWSKHTMYRASVGVPMIVAGPGAAEGRTCTTPASLVDVFPTIADAAGVHLTAADADLPGRSLLGTADEERVVFSEYHANYSANASYMVMDSRHKLIHYVGHPPQLFDMSTDVEETVDLADDPSHAEVLRRMDAALRDIVDPDDIDREAKAVQAKRVEQAGGVDAVLAGGQTLSYSPAPADFR